MENNYKKCIIVFLMIMIGQNSLISQERDLYLDNPLSYKIKISSKIFDGNKDKIFVDGLGREMHFRGMNVSGSSKIISTGHKPFKNIEDATDSFEKQKAKLGSNIVRFLITWEGVNPEVDYIDYQYLDDVIAQMKEAIHRRIYVIVDFHSDLYSRHQFRKDSWYTGDGAPLYIIEGSDLLGKEYCGIICAHWGQHKITDEATRGAMRAFWLNDEIDTKNGKRRIQDVFLWQLGKTIDYIRENMTDEEFAMIIGLEPINEPYAGGLALDGFPTTFLVNPLINLAPTIKEILEGWSSSKFDNDILWPFYERVRGVLNNNPHWKEKFVYAEPNVLWNSTLPFFIAGATGRSFLNNKPTDGFVFTPHLYDQARVGGIFDFSIPNNGAYFPNIFDYRDEARYLDLPIMITEFGGESAKGLGSSELKDGNLDHALMMNAQIQAYETTNESSAESFYGFFSKRSRRLDFYAPLISNTQWHWNYYHDKNQENPNYNPDIVEVLGDGWNKENFSIVKDYGENYRADYRIYERAYPRRVQGEIVNMFYNSLSRHAHNEEIKWGVLRLDHPFKFREKDYLHDNIFLYTTWRGRKSNAPTELYLPSHMTPENLIVITENKVFQKGQLNLDSPITGNKNEVILRRDNNKLSAPGIDYGIGKQDDFGLGYSLFAWDDLEENEDQNSYHFVLAFADNSNLSLDDLNDIQSSIVYMVKNETNPVYMSGETVNDFSFFNVSDWLSGDYLAYDSWEKSNGKSLRTAKTKSSNKQARNIEEDEQENEFYSMIYNQMVESTDDTIQFPPQPKIDSLLTDYYNTKKIDFYNEWKTSSGRSVTSQLFTDFDLPEVAKKEKIVKIVNKSTIENFSNWVYPDSNKEVEIISQDQEGKILEIKFLKDGTYDITLVNENSDGINYKTKSIVISDLPIKNEDVEVYPNPSVNKTFKLTHNLMHGKENDKSTITIYDQNGSVILTREVIGNKIAEQFNLQGISANFVLIAIKTPYETQSKKLMLK